MEKLIKELSYILDNEKLGLICKLCFAYIDKTEYTEEIDTNTQRYFNVSVRPRLDKILKERERSERRRTNAKEK